MRKSLLALVLCILFCSLSVYGDEYPTLSGDKISMQKILEGEKVILFFWTTWCPYCRIQIKTLNNLYEELESKDFKVYFINLQESRRKVYSVKKKMKIKYPILLDTLGSLGYRYKITGMPTYVFLKDAQEVGRTYNINKKYLEVLYEE